MKNFVLVYIFVLSCTCLSMVLCDQQLDLPECTELDRKTAQDEQMRCQRLQRKRSESLFRVITWQSLGFVELENDPLVKQFKETLCSALARVRHFRYFSTSCFINFLSLLRLWPTRQVSVLRSIRSSVRPEDKTSLQRKERGLVGHLKFASLFLLSIMSIKVKFLSWLIYVLLLSI